MPNTIQQSMPRNKQLHKKKVANIHSSHGESNKAATTTRDVSLPPEIWGMIASLLLPSDNVNLLCTCKAVGSYTARIHCTRMNEARAWVATLGPIDNMYSFFEALDKNLTQDKDYATALLARNMTLRDVMYQHYYSNYCKLWRTYTDRVQAIIVPLFGRMQNAFGDTMLHIAAMHGDVITAKTLICEYGIPVDILDCDNTTPIYYATRNDHVDVVSLLVEHGADAHGVCLPVSKRTPLHIAVDHGSKNVARWLLEYGVDPNKTTKYNEAALHLAIIEDDVDMVRLLAQFDANINALDEDGYTPLHDAILDKCYKSLYALIQLGANYNLRSFLGNTPLHDAIAAGDLQSVYWLLDRNVDVNIPNQNGLTALHLAMLSNSCWLWIVALYPGADFFYKDNLGRMPLDCAMQTIQHCERADKKKVYKMILEKAGCLSRSQQTLFNDVM